MNGNELRVQVYLNDERPLKNDIFPMEKLLEVNTIEKVSGRKEFVFNNIEDDEFFNILILMNEGDRSIQNAMSFHKIIYKRKLNTFEITDSGVKLL